VQLAGLFDHREAIREILTRRERPAAPVITTARIAASAAQSASDALSASVSGSSNAFSTSGLLRREDRDRAITFDP